MPGFSRSNESSVTPPWTWHDTVLECGGETEEAEEGALAEHFGNESVLRWWPLVTFIVLWRVPECLVN